MSFEVAADAYDAFMGRWSRLLSSALADLAGVAGRHLGNRFRKVQDQPEPSSQAWIPSNGSACAVSASDVSRQARSW
jgi:hypothetical protein